MEFCFELQLPRLERGMTLCLHKILKSGMIIYKGLVYQTFEICVEKKEVQVNPCESESWKKQKRPKMDKET
jgi:hypothetical protein